MNEYWYSRDFGIRVIRCKIKLKKFLITPNGEDSKLKKKNEDSKWIQYTADQSRQLMSSSSE